MHRKLTGSFIVVLAFVLPAACGGSDEGSSPKSGGSGGQGGSAGSGGVGATGGSSDSGSDAPTDAGNDSSSADAADAGDASDDASGDGSASCSPTCGSSELCDVAHAGIDDNCDGQVDEGCPCTPGVVEPCFKGDPSYRGTTGCYDGSALCDALGAWGACTGGVHATAPDNCYSATSIGCHPLETSPFGVVSLKSGTGSFSQDAAPGSETVSVTCPSGLSNCPEVKSPDSFLPLVSGEYRVTYTKTIQGTSTMDTCEYPLFVRAPGLRVELGWEHTSADSGVDLDLHVHEPGSTKFWGFSASEVQDCNWSNCNAAAFTAPTTMKWFADAPAAPPAAVNWWLDSVQSKNTCYLAPQGSGAIWQSIGLGCHNPRLDLENISCDATVTDPENSEFCAPENVNIDYPPTGKWTRIGVHYFSNHGLLYPVHPEVKIFCDGALAADLGPHGYSSPEQVVTFAGSDGAATSGNRFWIVADVGFTTDACGTSHCVVQPIYADAIARTAYFGTDTVAGQTFVPTYPAPL